jgi:hypothetical protein
VFRAEVKVDPLLLQEAVTKWEHAHLRAQNVDYDFESNFERYRSYVPTLGINEFPVERHQFLGSHKDHVPEISLKGLKLAFCVHLMHLYGL